MSPRTVISWAQNAVIFGDVGFAFRVSFLNKCDESRAAAGRRILPARVRRRNCPRAWSRRRARAAMADRARPCSPRARRRVARDRPGSRGRRRLRRRGRVGRRQDGARAIARSRALEPRLVAEARGAADALALRLRHHDARSIAPTAPPIRMRARSSKRLERARVEALGARAWAACAANLASLPRPAYAATRSSAPAPREEVPLATAVGLIARERLTGDAPPGPRLPGSSWSRRGSRTRPAPSSTRWR